MLLYMKEEQIIKAVKIYLSKIYEIDIDSIEIDSLDIEQLVSGDFKGESPFGNEKTYLLMDIYINGVLVRELFSDPAIIFRMVELFIIHEMKLKKDSFLIEEIFNPTEKQKECDGIMTVVNFYSNNE